MKLTQDTRTINVAGHNLRGRRTTGGVIELSGNNNLEVQRGLGFFHAHDRMVQMLLVRLIGEGRLCECLKDDDESLAIDIFMRTRGFAQVSRNEVERLSPRAREIGQAYAEGINDYLARHARPVEFRLAGYRPEPWSLADSLLTINLMTYIGLAQTQEDVEKLLVQTIQHGADIGRLKKLFSPHLDGLTDELIDLIRRVRVFDPVVPPLPAVLPAFKASNNWAVSAARSATGTALECHDPHLECNRLPAVWYEAVLHTPDNYEVGITMPGVPGIVMGRTRDVSAGFTYGFMDMVDYFIEECRDGTYRRDDGWKLFRQRCETIRRKKHEPLEIVIYENEHGTLECDPQTRAPEDGFYLCRAYSGQRSGAARSMDALADVSRAKSTDEVRLAVRNVSISCNWVIADRHGNIAYQQSGLLPARKASGLYPVPGWWTDHAWQGLVPPEELSSIVNPPEGFIATANDDRNQPGRPLSINLCQGFYRAERIAELLNTSPRLSVADMQRIQCDLLSPQARRFMAVLRNLIPDTPTGRILSEWDLCYDPRSRGPTLFEAFYQSLLRELFGKGLFGLPTWDAFISSTSLMGVYFQRLDDALLGDDPAWFGGRTRDDVFRSVLEGTLGIPAESVRPWGEQRQVMMRNLFFGGKLPAIVNRLFGVDYGPITIPGGRATIVQGQIFKSHGRLTTFAPSFRSVTDLGTDEVHTALAGGPSGRILSGLYTSDIERWLAFAYKTLNCGEELP